VHCHIEGKCYSDQMRLWLCWSGIAYHLCLFEAGVYLNVSRNHPHYVRFKQKKEG